MSRVRIRGGASPRSGAALLAAALLIGLACGRAPFDPAPGIVRLISEEPRGTLVPGTLGNEIPVLDGSFGDGGWQPAGAPGSWRLEDGSLVIESGVATFDLERWVDLDATDLDALEVTLASGYKVRLALVWQRAGEAEGRPASWVEPGLVLEYPEGRGQPHRKTFTFDLRSHAQWSGAITRLRLRLEAAREREKIVVRQLRGFRETVSSAALAEQARHVWWLELDRERRRVLVVPPGYPVEREVVVPESSVLEFALGATGRLAAPVDLRIVATRPRAAPALLFETRLEPVATNATRSWQRQTVDLGAFGGERIQIRAESRAGDGFDGSLGFPAWATPEIVPATTEPKPPNVILISIDTLRADRLGVYGYEHPTSPRIDAWAKRHALVFANAVAQAPWTLPSHSSMLTGLDALRHGVNHPFRAAPEELVTLAERLHEEGYFTAGITGGGWLHPHYGLAQGYDRYRYWLESRRGDAELELHAELAGRWLEELREPFFLFIHSYDVHDFNAPGHPAAGPGGTVAGDARPQLVRRYDRAVSHMDSLVGGFLERFESRGLRGRTMLALTSDHGQDLGEDGVYGHGSLRDQVLLVPLVLELPDGQGARETVKEQVRSIDVVPTLLDLAGLAVSSELDGVSLVDLIRGDPAAVPAVASSYFSLNHGLSLRFRNQWKYVFDNAAWRPESDREALYRLPDESPKRHDLAPDDPRAGRFRAHARRLLDERLAGLRMRFENPTSASFAGSLSGELIDAGVPKSTDLEGSWVTHVAAGVAAFSVPPGERFHLLFERLGEPRFELAAVPAAGADAGEAGRLTIDLEELDLPAAWRWTGTGWQVAALAAGAAEASGPRVTIEWHRAAGLETSAPFERDPELRQQLEALGYLD